MMISPRSWNWTFSDRSACVPMTTDDDVRRARQQPRARALAGFGRLESAHRLDPHGRSLEPRQKRFVVLFGQDGRRRQQGNLLAVHGHDERRAHRDFRLAVAGVAADQAIHRTGRGEIALHVLDGARLVGRGLPRKRRLERVDARQRKVVGEARHDGTPGLRLQERCG